MTSQTVNNNFIGFAGVLTIIFILLKVFGKISWSWFWVLSPVIFQVVLILVFLIILGLIWIKAG